MHLPLRISVFKDPCRGSVAPRRGFHRLHRDVSAGCGAAAAIDVTNTGSPAPGPFSFEISTAGS